MHTDFFCTLRGTCSREIRKIDTGYQQHKNGNCAENINGMNITRCAEIMRKIQVKMYSSDGLEMKADIIALLSEINQRHAYCLLHLRRHIFLNNLRQLRFQLFIIIIFCQHEVSKKI